MEVINATRMPVACNMGLTVDGGELLVIVIKGTFVIPPNGSPVLLADVQLPHVMADVFAGEPGFSAPLWEAEFAPWKQQCDISVIGHAHAREGMQVTDMLTRVRVGSLEKSVRVVGDRTWQWSLGKITTSAPRAFSQMALSYDGAFGGADRRHSDPARHGVFLANPVGRGWHRHLRRDWVDGEPLPNLEAPDDPVRSPDGHHRPMSFGVMGRNWAPRLGFAGTYDDRWLAECFPFLPSDFDGRFYQSVAADQQLDVPFAPLDVELTGFFADGPRHFTIPHFDAPVHVIPRRGSREDLIAKLDTVVFEPDDSRFTLCWRATRPIAKSIHEIGQVVIGRKGAAWWQQRSTAAFPIPVVAAPSPTAATPLLV